MRDHQKYDIEIYKKISYNFQITANSYEEAKEKAYKLYEKAEDEGTINEYIYDTDISIEEDY